MIITLNFQFNLGGDNLPPCLVFEYVNFLTLKKWAQNGRNAGIARVWPLSLFVAVIIGRGAIFGK